MIDSASSSSGPSRADALAAAAAAATTRVPRPPSDQLHLGHVSALRTSLGRLPEIRPEVVSRARFLASDPAYPSDRIIRQVSAAIVDSPDLSEDPA